MFNSPINDFQQLFVITAEECAELTQVCMKMMRKYQDDRYVQEEDWQKVIEEAGDVFCMLELFVQTGLFNWEDLHNRSDIKREKLKTWSTLIK